MNNKEIKIDDITDKGHLKIFKTNTDLKNIFKKGRHFTISYIINHNIKINVDYEKIPINLSDYKKQIEF